MLDNIKMMKMETDSLKYIKENKEKIERERKIQEDEHKNNRKGMDMLKITVN